MHNLEKSIQKIVKGDNSGLKDIYDLLSYAIYTQSYFITKNHHLAEDVSQEVFIKIMKSANTYKKGTNPKAWIIQIAKNCAIDKLRSKDIYSEDLGNETEYINYMANTKQKDKLVERIILFDEIKKLDFESQQIIILHVLVGLKFKEIANFLNMPLGTITWKYQMIIKKLNEKLK